MQKEDVNGRIDHRADTMLDTYDLSPDIRDGIRPGLTAMLGALDRTEGLTEVGHSRAMALLTDNLRRIAAVDADRRRYPEIAEVEIVRPVFILGLPRCGTSLLHALISSDPGVRTPMSWEVADPSPPPEAATFAQDPRAKAFDDYVATAFSGEWADMLKAHPIGAWIPQEDGMILETSFQSINPLTQYRMPDYYPWYLQQDSRFGYRVHRMFLQHLSWKNPRERWVCKVQEHANHLPSLFAEYPDAMLVQPHRDPAAVQASICRLFEVLRGPAFDHQDRHALGQELLQLWHDGQVRMMAYRRAHPEMPVMDLAYRDLAAEPLQTVERVYAFAGIPFTSATSDGVNAWLAENPAGKHGKHVYSLDDYGLTIDEVHAFYADYIEAYEEFI